MCFEPLRREKGGNPRNTRNDVFCSCWNFMTLMDLGSPPHLATIFHFETWGWGKEELLQCRGLVHSVPLSLKENASKQMAIESNTLPGPWTVVKETAKGSCELFIFQ